jgi:hypothetical protein
VGSRASLDAVVRGKIPSPYRDSKPRSSRPYPSATALSYPGSKKTRTSAEKASKLDIIVRPKKIYWLKFMTRR